MELEIGGLERTSSLSFEQEREWSLFESRVGAGKDLEHGAIAKDAAHAKQILKDHPHIMQVFIKPTLSEEALDAISSVMYKELIALKLTGEAQERGEIPESEQLNIDLIWYPKFMKDHPQMHEALSQHIKTDVLEGMFFALRGGAEDISWHQDMLDENDEQISISIALAYESTSYIEKEHIRASAQKQWPFVRGTIKNRSGEEHRVTPPLGTQMIHRFDGSWHRGPDKSRCFMVGVLENV